jgi:hypothetical protein
MEKQEIIWTLGYLICVFGLFLLLDRMRKSIMRKSDCDLKKAGEDKVLERKKWLNDATKDLEIELTIVYNNKVKNIMREKEIRQAITGIIHGDREITKESAEYAATKGKEVMEFLINNDLLYKMPQDQGIRIPVGSLFKCEVCEERKYSSVKYEFLVIIQQDQRFCQRCGEYVSGPRLNPKIRPDTTYGSGTLT